MARDMRVRWALEEVGQPYDVRLRSMTALKEPEHRARNPFGSIPTYEEGDLTLFESGAIVFHIAERHPALFPKDADARARVIMWMFAALDTVQPPIVNDAEASIFEKGKSWQREHLAMIEKNVRTRLADLSNALGDAEWLAGEFSAADILMVQVLRWERRVVQEYSNLAAYVARGEARPAFQRAFAAQAEVFRQANRKKGEGLSSTFAVRWPPRLACRASDPLTSTPGKDSAMPEVIAELIVSLNMKARGKKSPGYYGYNGPQLDAYFKKAGKRPYRNLIGRKTYRLMNDLPDEAKDEGWQEIADHPGYLFSRKLKTVEWPGLQLVNSDMVAFVRKLKKGDGPELRVLGSLSIVRQLAEAKLLDMIRLTVCPLVLPETGIEPVFKGWPDLAFDLASQEVLDDRLLVLEYRPAGDPPTENSWTG